MSPQLYVSTVHSSFRSPGGAVALPDSTSKCRCSSFNMSFWRRNQNISANDNIHWMPRNESASEMGEFEMHGGRTDKQTGDTLCTVLANSVCLRRGKTKIVGSLFKTTIRNALKPNCSHQKSQAAIVTQDHTRWR